MRKFITKAFAYLVLSIIGAVFSIYAIQARNLVLLIAAVLFAIVSADNIFCNLKDKKLSKKNELNKK